MPTPPHFTTARRRARLAGRHRLVPSARVDDVRAIADDLVAVHSTDPVTVYLSILARMSAPSLDAVSHALYDDRDLVRHHAMRRTLWVATRPIVRAMHAATTTRLVAPERRRTRTLLADNGIADPDAWIDAAREHVLAALADGPLPARELGVRVPELNHRLVQSRGKKYEASVGAHTRILLELGFEGTLVRARPVGSWINGQYTWAHTGQWLGEPIAGLDERAAQRTLAHAYLARFGPATTTDVRWWAGWTVATTRRALADCGAVEVTTDDGPAWIAADDPSLDTPRPGDDPGEWVALLPSLDSSVMGWKERGWYLPPESIDTFDTIGNAGPSVWVDGVVVGAWAQRADGEIRVHWFRDLPARRRRDVLTRAAELGSWLGGVRYTSRFPGTITSALLAPASP